MRFRRRDHEFKVLAKAKSDAMLLGASVGWELAHKEMCPRAETCSTHQPIDAASQRPRLVAALAVRLLFGQDFDVDRAKREGRDD